jgi:PAS domain S-box-containing protein
VIKGDFLLDFFSKLFETDGFPPRWFCGTWPESLGWIHVFSDLTIFLAYTAIPLVLVYFVYMRKELPFLPIFWLFGLFIFFCGFGHLIEASMFWTPWYRFSGLIKLCTAVVSTLTVFSLFKIIPEVIKIPKARRKFEEFILANPYAIITFNKKGTIEFFNPGITQFFGYAVSELTSMSIFDLLQKEDKKTLVKKIDLLFKEHHDAKQPIMFEAVGIEKSGNKMPLLLRMNLVNESPSRVSVICSITDLTEEKKMEREKEIHLEKIEKSNMELEAFARSISHDMKEPIRGIRKYAQKSLDTVNQENQNNIRSIISLTDSLYGMITELLDYSMLEKIKSSINCVDLNSILEKTIESINHLAQEKNAVIVIEDKLPMLNCDSIRLAQVFGNLITNALKYNKSANPEVRISYQKEEEQDYIKHSFCVKDNGIGINEKNFKNIFNIFKRLHSRDKYGGGTGVGLSTVKKIVEQHDGEIWVESEFGKGSAFHFTIIEKRVSLKESA